MSRRLQLVSVLAIIAATARLAAAGADCTGVTGFKCDSCSTLALCSGDTIASTFTCKSDEMCEEGASPPGLCTAISDASRTKCQCGTTFPSYVVDSYDPQKYILCFSATLQLPLSCPPGEEFDEATSKCAPVPTTTAATTTTQPTVTCEEDGIFPLLPGCSGYYGCYSVGGSLMSTGIVSCTPPQVFNPDTLACADTITAPGAPTCGASDIVAADTVECNAFFICSSGNAVGEKICCGDGEVFNPDSIRCVADTGSVTCPTVNPCFTGDVEMSCMSATTTASSTTPTSTTNTATSSTASSASTTMSSSSTDSSSTASMSSTDSSSTVSTSTPDSSSTVSTSTTDSSSTVSTSTPDSSSTASTSTTDSSSTVSTSTPDSSTVSTSSTDSSSTVGTSSTDSTSTVSTSSTDSSTVSTSSTDSSSTVSTSSTDSSTVSTSSTDSSSTVSTSSADSTSSTTAGPPDCTADSGSFPYPGDCTKYYFCYQGELAEQSCPGSFIFSPGVGCTLPSNYDCPY